MSEESEMSDESTVSEQKPVIGAIEWRDLTVDSASEVKDFYQKVVGWTSSGVPMGNGAYEDYNINLPESGETIAGVCHAKGFNEGLPAQWLMYVRVGSVLDSIVECEKMGGKVLWGPKEMGSDLFCVIEDPAGAVLGLVASKS